MARKKTLTGWLVGYGMVLGLTMLTALLVLVHAGRLLNIAFPIMVTLVAGALYITRQSVYAAFVWWIWLFSPLVRRLVDYQTTYHDISPVMLAPLLVTGFALISLLRRPRFVLRRSMVPFFLIMLVLFYSLIVGVFINGVLPAAFEFLNWLEPLAFGVYLMMNPKALEETRDALVFAILSGLLIISLYGLYQFYHMPPWDAYWINASQFTTAGQGIAEEVRVFSTLNSPGPYAIVLMVSLIFVVVAKGPLRLMAGGVGFPAFGLSLVRSSWGGWVIAAAYIVWRVGGRTRLRILIVGIFLALVAVPLVTAGPVAKKLAERFSSISNIQQDTSFKARQNTYENFTADAFSQPIGVGFGQLGLATKLTTGNAVILDSGVLQAPFEFGWVGTGIFVWAIGVLLLGVFKATFKSKDRIAIAGAGLFFAMVAQNIFATTFTGVLGLSLWLGVALALGPVQVARTAALAIPGQKFRSVRQLA